MAGEERRVQILRVAMRLFSQRGFRGTTTKEIAVASGVSEAMVFRHFATKEELYSAIIEQKVGIEKHDSKLEEFQRLAATNDDEKFFQAIGRAFLEKHETDTTFLRLLLFSALEGHQLSDMFAATMAARHPLTNYIQRRLDEGAFRGDVDAQLSARAFLGMFASFTLWQEIFGFKKKQPHDREEVVRTFVSIFLQGIAK